MQSITTLHSKFASYATHVNMKLFVSFLRHLATQDQRYGFKCLKWAFKISSENKMCYVRNKVAKETRNVTQNIMIRIENGVRKTYYTKNGGEEQRKWTRGKRETKPKQLHGFQVFEW